MTEDKVLGAFLSNPVVTYTLSALLSYQPSTTLKHPTCLMNPLLFLCQPYPCPTLPSPTRTLQYTVTNRPQGVSFPRLQLPCLTLASVTSLYNAPQEARILKCFFMILLCVMLCIIPAKGLSHEMLVSL